MKLDIAWSQQFKKDYRRAMKRGKNIQLLDDIIDLLARCEPLPAHNRDHSLSGDYIGFRECHIAPDWLLVYHIDNGVLVLTLSRTGSHSDLF